MKRYRRRFGDWQLFTSRPVTLGCYPYGNSSPYHVELRTCSSQAAYDDWVKHLSEKPGFDVAGFKKAIETLRAEGIYLKW